MRSPSSSGGSPRTASSRSRSRTQPASNQPQATAAATAPSRSPARRPKAAAPDAPLDHQTPRTGRDALSLELLEHRLDRDDVALELQLRLLEPGGDADQLREVEDRHLEVAARRRLQLRLPRVEREVAERARRHHRVGAGLVACSIGWISSPSAVSSRAWMIGKPQHLIFAG